MHMLAEVSKDAEVAQRCRKGRPWELVLIEEMIT
jgi:hypothetical protein